MRFCPIVKKDLPSICTHTHTHESEKRGRKRDITKTKKENTTTAKKFFASSQAPSNTRKQQGFIMCVFLCVK